MLITVRMAEIKPQMVSDVYENLKIISFYVCGDNGLVYFSLT